MFRIVILLTVLLFDKCDGNYGDAFGLINRQQTFCELNSMTTASKLIDSFNSMDEAATIEDRMKQEYVVNNLGFGWNYAFMSRSHEHVTEPEVQDAQKMVGWIGDTGTPPAYKYIDNKWLYFYGDHTLRHIASTFLLPVHGKEMHSMKEWTSSKCVQQSHRGSGDEDAADAAGTGKEAAGGAHGGHNYKARTCQFPGYGSEGKVTYDWKHTPYDEYDEWLFGTDGVWSTQAAHVPDYLIIQIGHSTCLPSSDPEKSLTELQHSEQTFETHVVEIDKLLDSIKTAVTRSTEQSNSQQQQQQQKGTTVIISTASRTAIGNPHADFCTWKLNRIIARAAHRRGFIVFEREEIEHRLLFKTEASEDLYNAGVLDKAAEPPMAHIVSTSLLSMLTCLNSNVIQPPSV